LSSVLVLVATALAPVPTGVAASLITDIGTLTPGASRITMVNDANRNSRVVGVFDAYGQGCNRGQVGFTWAPGGAPVRLTLPGYPKSYAIAVNDNDLVVGWADPTCAEGSARMFSWTPSGGIVDLGEGQVFDVNDSGQILGQGPVEVSPGQFDTRAFVWTPGQPKVPLPDSLGILFPKRLSNNGHVTGAFLSSQGTQRGFYWTAAGGIVDLGSYQSNGWDVNANGMVVGDRTASPSSPQRAFAWTAGGGFAGFALDDQYSIAYDVNNAGQAVGWSWIDYEEHAMSWTAAGGVVDLGTLARDDGYAFGCGFGRAYAVNEQGLVVGDTYVQKGNLCFHQPFAWTSATGMVNLGTLEGGEGEAYQVTDSGRAFGVSYTGGFESHAVMWQTAFTAVLPDVNGNGVADLALLRERPIHVEIRDGSTAALVTVLPVLADSFVPLAATSLPDSDGNGVAELAVLAARRSDGRIVVEIRNLAGAAVTRQIWFSPGQTPERMIVVGDADANGVVDIAVLSTRKSDGRGLVEVRNAFGLQNPRVLAVAADTQVKDIEPVGDADTNGVPEFAVLGTRNSDGRGFVEIRNAAGVANARTVWFANGHSPVDLAAVADADGNGVSEVAVLSRRISDNRYAVEVKNAAGPTNAFTTWVALDLRAIALQSLGDADGNSVPELAVLSHRNYDARAVIEVKNAAGTVSGRTFWLPTGLRGGDMVASPDTSGDGIPEVFVVMTRGDARIVVERRNAAGPAASQSYWFRP
jgi:probable HAF family extracellular repeat protein